MWDRVTCSYDTRGIQTLALAPEPLSHCRSADSPLQTLQSGIRSHLQCRVPFPSKSSVSIYVTATGKAPHTSLKGPEYNIRDPARDAGVALRRVSSLDVCSTQTRKLLLQRSALLGQ